MQPPAGGYSPTPPPPPAVDLEVAIRAAYANAESAQGPLDGGWRLSGPDGSGLFAFMLADTGGGPAPRSSTPSNPQIEGAWRDLRHEGAVTASGILVSVVHIADTVEIRFYESDPSAMTVVRLHTDASGAWSGDLVEAGATTPVTMKRF